MPCNATSGTLLDMLLTMLFMFTLKSYNRGIGLVDPSRAKPHHLEIWNHSLVLMTPIKCQGSMLSMFTGSPCHGVKRKTCMLRTPEDEKDMNFWRSIDCFPEQVFLERHRVFRPDELQRKLATLISGATLMICLQRQRGFRVGDMWTFAGLLT